MRLLGQSPSPEYSGGPLRDPYTTALRSRSKNIISGYSRDEIDQDKRQGDAAKTVQDAYIRSLEDQIAFLRRELERKDAILLNLSSKIPQLEPPEAPETVEEAPESAEPHPGTEEPQEAAQRRSWWRRMFGG